jgi:hypothetical protein
MAVRTAGSTVTVVVVGVSLDSIAGLVAGKGEGISMICTVDGAGKVSVFIGVVVHDDRDKNIIITIRSDNGFFIYRGSDIQLSRSIAA